MSRPSCIRFPSFPRATTSLLAACPSQQDPGAALGSITAELCLLVSMAACPQSTDVSAGEDTVLLPQFWLKNCLLGEARQRAQTLQDQQRVMERTMPQKSSCLYYSLFQFKQE